MDIDEMLFNEAISKGELVKFLGGYPGYVIQEKFADMPTDYNAVFNPIDKRMKDDHNLKEVVIDAIKSLAQDPVYGWGAIFHLTNLVRLRNRQGIDLLTSELLISVSNSLRQNKGAYESLKRWEGKNHENGVWAWVRSENRNLHNDYNITVLPEEL